MEGVPALSLAQKFNTVSMIKEAAKLQNAHMEFVKVQAK